MLGLVGDDKPKRDRREELPVAGQGPVRGDYEVRGAQGTRLREAFLAVVDVDPERGREPGGLAPPVLDERGRAHDKACRGARGIRASEDGERLEGLSQTHLVGEDAPEAVFRQVPEPGTPQLLVGPHLRGEFRRGGGPRKDGQGLERLRALAPGRRRREAREKFRQEFLHLGGPREGEPVRALRGARCRGIAQEGALDLLDPADFLGVDEVDEAVRLHVGAIGRLSGPEGRRIGGAGAQAHAHREGIPLQICGALDRGGLYLGGVLLEVLGELRPEAIAQALQVGGEEGKDLVAVADPPAAIRGLQDEARALHEFQGGRVAEVLAGGEGDGEEVLGAVHDHGSLVGGGAAGPCRGGDGDCGRCGSFLQEFVVRPRERPGVLDPDRRRPQGPRELAKLRPGQLQERRKGRGHAPALEERQGRQEHGLRGLVRLEFYPHRNGIPKHRFGEVGGEVKTQRHC